MSEFTEQSKTWAGGDMDMALSGSSFHGDNALSKAAPVMREYGTLSKELQVLAEIVDNLRTKLEPVLGMERTECADGTKDVPQAGLSPLGESLRSDTQRVRNIQSELRTLLSRIEV
jgi:hypothetical protein